MAGGDTSVTGSCLCDSDHTGSCAVEEDEAEETGRKEWLDMSLHELGSIHTSNFKESSFYILFVVVVHICSGRKFGCFEAKIEESERPTLARK